jgi:hypothetical protein
MIFTTVRSKISIKWYLINSAKSLPSVTYGLKLQKSPGHKTGAVQGENF